MAFHRAKLRSNNEVVFVETNTRTRKMGVCLCSLLLFATGVAECAFSSQEQRYQYLMPMGENFPGYPPADAERVSQTIHFALQPEGLSQLRLHHPPEHWQSTGLYRVPGEPVRVTVRPAEGNRPDVMPKLRVGIHRLRKNVLDRVMSKFGGANADDVSVSRRASRASHSFTLRQGEQQDSGLASGLIYMESSQTGTEAFEVTLAGAVRAPWFKIGRDSLIQWQNDIRYYPAPWAELEGRHAILTLPSAMIRQMADPTAIIAFYDQMVKDVQNLIGLSENAEDERDRAPAVPWRFVLDPILSDTPFAAVSGYPVAINWVAYANPYIWITPEMPIVRTTLLHELGHNHEPVEKLFELPGTREVFAELMNYGYQSSTGYRVIGIQKLKGLKAYTAKEILYAYLPLLSHLFHSYDSHIWGEDPYHGIAQKKAFMINLVRHLSHEFIAELYSNFRHTPADQLPDKNNQQQKTDYFFEMLCDISRQDLTRFFQQWDVPVSQDACQRVAEKNYPMPPWSGHDEL